jgi:hypothetical protein
MLYHDQLLPKCHLVRRILCCSSLRLSIDSLLFIVAPAPRHVNICCQSSSVCSQKQHCIILHWLRLCILCVHQKLNISFVSVGCCALGVLWNVILKYFHAMPSHIFWLFLVIFDVTFFHGGRERCVVPEIVSCHV